MGHSGIRKILFFDIPALSWKETNSDYCEINRLKYKYDAMSYSPQYTKHLQGRCYGGGVLALAAYVSSLDIDIEYVDYETYVGNPSSIYFADFDLIAINLLFASTEAVVIKIAEIIKQQNPKAFVVVGGQHATFLSRQVLSRTNSIDAVVLHEGEIPLYNLIRAFPDIEDVAGILLKANRKNDVAQLTASILNGADIPSPRYDLLPAPLKGYGLRTTTSRGCLFQCAFCTESAFFKKVRFRPIDHIIAELEGISNKLLERQHMHFNDSIFTLDNMRTVELCREISRANLNLSFSCDSMAGFVTTSALKAMMKAGFTRICIGLEDPDANILKIANKSLSFNEFYETAQLIRNNSDMKIAAYTIFGLPGSTFQTMKNYTSTVCRLVETGLVDEVYDAMFVPQPGSDICENSGKYGIKIVEDNLDRHRRESFSPIYELDSMGRDRIQEGFYGYRKCLIEAYRKRYGDIGQ